MNYSCKIYPKYLRNVTCCSKTEHIQTQFLILSYFGDSYVQQVDDVAIIFSLKMPKQLEHKTEKVEESHLEIKTIFNLWSTHFLVGARSGRNLCRPPPRPAFLVKIIQTEMD